MHLLVTLRLLLRCLRASLHAALVVSLGVALFLRFILWSVMQIVDEREVAGAHAEDTAHPMLDKEITY